MFMIKMSYFLYCDGIQLVAGDKRPHIVGPKQVLLPKFIPSDYSFGIAFGIAGVDLTQDNEVLVKFVSPEKKIVAEKNLDIKIPNVEISLPAEELGLMLTMDFRNVSIEEEGEYNSEVYLNSELVSTNAIRAYKGKEQKGEPND